MKELFLLIMLIVVQTPAAVQSQTIELKNTSNDTTISVKYSYASTGWISLEPNQDGQLRITVPTELFAKRSYVRLRLEIEWKPIRNNANAQFRSFRNTTVSQDLILRSWLQDTIYTIETSFLTGWQVRDLEDYDAQRASSSAPEVFFAARLMSQHLRSLTQDLTSPRYIRAIKIAADAGTRLASTAHHRLYWANEDLRNDLLELQTERSVNVERHLNSFDRFFVQHLNDLYKADIVRDLNCAQLADFYSFHMEIAAAENELARGHLDGNDPISTIKKNRDDQLVISNCDNS